MSDFPMVTPGYVRVMARYNRGMNERLYEAAARLSDEERKKPRGAFWSSLHGTYNHLLWGDTLWMSRFDPAHWQRPATAQKDSATMIADFDALSAARRDADARIAAWAKDVTGDWLAGTMTWVSGAAGRELTLPASFVVTHFFNHQTHHRGQAHALITATGEKTADTDLFLALT